eukprot:gene9084-2971_t
MKLEVYWGTVETPIDQISERFGTQIGHVKFAIRDDQYIYMLINEDRVDNTPDYHYPRNQVHRWFIPDFVSNEKMHQWIAYSNNGSPVGDRRTNVNRIRCVFQRKR